MHNLGTVKFLKGGTMKEVQKIKVEAAVRESARRIWKTPYEVMEILSPEGELIFSATIYQCNRIELTDEQEQLCVGRPGVIMVYNYGVDTPPPINDLLYAERLQASRLVLVTPHFLYSITCGEKGWTNGEELNQVIDQHKHLLKVVKRYATNYGCTLYEVEMTDPLLKILCRRMRYRLTRQSIGSEFQK